MRLTYWKVLSVSSAGAWTVAFGFIAAHMSAIRERDERIARGYDVVSVAKEDLTSVSVCAQGKANAPYVLSVFFDYECPYCREASVEIDRMLKKHPTRLRVVFRNFPLERIHEDAWRASVASVVAGKHGQFAKMKARLVTSSNTAPSVEANVKAILPQVSVTKEEVRESAKAVLEDVALAKRLGVDTTPSLYLVDPQGVTRLFDSTEKVSTYLDQVAKAAPSSGKAASGDCPEDCQAPKS